MTALPPPDGPIESVKRIALTVAIIFPMLLVLDRIGVLP